MPFDFKSMFDSLLGDDEEKQDDSLSGFDFDSAFKFGDDPDPVFTLPEKIGGFAMNPAATLMEAIHSTDSGAAQQAQARAMAARAMDSIGGLAYGAPEFLGAATDNDHPVFEKLAQFTPLGIAEKLITGKNDMAHKVGETVGDYSSPINMLKTMLDDNGIDLGVEPGTRHEMRKAVQDKVDYAAALAEKAAGSGAAKAVQIGDTIVDIAAPMASGLVGGRLAASAGAGEGAGMLLKAVGNSMPARTGMAMLSGATQATLEDPQNALTAAPFGAVLGAGGNLLLGELPTKIMQNKTVNALLKKFSDKPMDPGMVATLEDLRDNLVAKEHFETVTKPRLRDDIAELDSDRKDFRKMWMGVKATHKAELDDLKIRRQNIEDAYESRLHDLQENYETLVVDPDGHRMYKESLGLLKETRSRNLELLNAERKNLLDQQKTARSAFANEMRGKKNAIAELKEHEQNLSNELKTRIKGEHRAIDPTVPDAKLTPRSHARKVQEEVDSAMEAIGERVQAQKDISLMNLDHPEKSEREIVGPLYRAWLQAKSFMVGGSDRNKIGRIGGIRNAANFVLAEASFANRDAKKVLRSIPQFDKMAKEERQAILDEMSRIGMDYRAHRDRVAKDLGVTTQDLETRIHKAWKFGRIEGEIQDPDLLASINSHKDLMERLINQAIALGADRKTIAGIKWRGRDYITQSYSTHYFDDPDAYLASRLSQDPQAIEDALNTIMERNLERGGPYAGMSREALRNSAIGDLRQMLTSPSAYEASLRQPGVVPTVKGSQFETTVKSRGLEEKWIEVTPDTLVEVEKRRAKGETVGVIEMMDQFLREHAPPKAANRVRTTFEQYVSDEMAYRQKTNPPKDTVSFVEPNSGATVTLTLTHSDQHQIMYPGVKPGPMYRITTWHNPTPGTSGGVDVMRKALAYADSVGVQVPARAVAYAGTDQARLEGLYKKLGFRLVSGDDAVPTAGNVFLRDAAPLPEDRLQKLFTLALKEEDFPETIRKAMGEITDVDFLMTKAATDMAHDTTVMKLYSNIRDAAVANGLASVGIRSHDSFVPLRGDERMGLVQPDIRTRMTEDPDTGEEALKLMGGGDDQGVIWVAPEVKQLMTAIVDRTNEMGVLMKAANTAKYFKVLSVPQTVANFWSASMSFAATGDGARLGMSMLRNPKKAWGMLNATQKIVVSTFLGGGGELPKAMKASMGATAKQLGWDELAYHALGGDNGKIVGLVEDMTRRGVLEGGAGQEMMTLVARVKDSAAMGDTAKLHSEVMDLAGRFYQSPDVMVKALAYQVRLEEITRAEGLKAPTEGIKDMVAEMINNEYQTFSRTPEFAKMLSRNPMTAGFTTFPMEMVRNQFNMLKQMNAYGKQAEAAKLAGDVTKQRAYEMLMVKSVASFTTMVYGLNMLRNTVQEKMGWSDETQSNISELAAPPGQSSAPLWISDIDKESKEVTYLNLGRLHPYSVTNSALRAMSKSNPRDVGERVAEFASEQLDNFNLMGVFGKATTEALTGERWNGLGDAFRSRDSYVDNPNAPGVFDETNTIEDKANGRRMYRAWRNLGPSQMLKVENIYRGLTDDPAGSKRYDAELEAQAHITGMMPVVQKLDVALRGKLRPTGKKIDSLRNDYKNLVNKIPPSDLDRFRSVRESKQAELFTKLEEAKFWIERARGVRPGGVGMFDDDTLDEYLNAAGFRESKIRNYLLYDDELDIVELWGDGE